MASCELIVSLQSNGGLDDALLPLLLQQSSGTAPVPACIYKRVKKIMGPQARP